MPYTSFALPSVSNYTGYLKPLLFISAKAIRFENFNTGLVTAALFLALSVGLLVTMVMTLTLWYLMRFFLRKKLKDFI